MPHRDTPGIGSHFWARVGHLPEKERKKAISKKRRAEAKAAKAKEPGTPAQLRACALAPRGVS